MTDNPGAQPPTAGPSRPTLRLTGTDPVDAQAARSAPVAVSLLRVQDGSSSNTADAKGSEVIPFEALVQTGGSQPAIRSCLVGGRVPGAVIFRLR